MAVTSINVFRNGAIGSSGGSITSTPVIVTSATLGFSLAGKATSVAGTAGCKVEYEVSSDGVNYDTTTTSPSRTIFTDLAESYVSQAVHLPVCSHVRFRVTDNLTGLTDTLVNLVFSYVER